MRRRDDDSLWKEFLKHFLYSFIKVLNKELYDAIDTTKRYEVIDPSLRIPGLRKGKAIYVDFLARVPLLSGDEATILAHIEIQGYGGTVPFDKRMFAYFSRLLIKYDTAVTAVALFTGDGEPPSGKYEQKCFGTDFAYGYTLRSLDEFDEEELRLDDSPAALMILAVKLAKECANDENFKLSCLKELVNLMVARNWSDDDKENMLLLCEGIIHIEDEEAEEEFCEFIKEREEPEMFVSILQKKAKAEGLSEGLSQGLSRGLSQGMSQGMSQGKLEGKLEAITGVVQNMFRSKIPVPKIAKIASLPESEILKILQM